MEVVLIMGIDDREDLGNTKFAINNSQADVLYVFAVDHKNKTYQAIQLNRETMTGIQTYNNDGTKDAIAEAQICLAHSFGKTEQGRCLNTVDAVSGLLFNMPIDHYISLNMAAISILNEQVGGVSVIVPAGLEEADEYAKGQLGAFNAFFPTTAAAMSYLVFNLFDSPCLAAISTVAKEIGSKKHFWKALLFQNVAAYCVALMVYQFGGVFVTREISFSAATVAAILIFAALLYLLFRRDPNKVTASESHV